jgi:AcrR family transcriptional regulator
MNTACSNRTEHTERTRQEILRAALRLFATRGYAGTSTQVIVKTAQVAKPVLYYHFGNKAGLFQAVIDEIDNRLLGLILASEAEAANAPGQLVAICAAVFRFTCDHPEVMELIVDLLLEARRQELPGKYSLGKAHQRLAVIRKIMGQGMREGTLRDQFDEGGNASRPVQQPVVGCWLPWHDPFSRSFSVGQSPVSLDPSDSRTRGNFVSGRGRNWQIEASLPDSNQTSQSSSSKPQRIRRA